MSAPFIIVGLGNPGRRYERTRHNIGFRLIDQLADHLGISVTQSKWQALMGSGLYQGQKILLVKPQTYMNNSGQSVWEFVAFYKVPHDHLLVLYDDIDIALGTIRVRMEGSAGSHNGMRSVVRELGFQDFPRIRLAVGRRTVEEDLADFVLSPFTDADEAIIEEELAAGKDAVLTLLTEGTGAAMNRWNGWISDRVPAADSPEGRQRKKEEIKRRAQLALLAEAKKCGDR